MHNVNKTNKLKKELDSLRPIKKEDEQRTLQKLRLDWNYHSNNLEGNSLTYGETKALILFGITAQGKPLKDHFEITGHNEAILWVMDIVKQERPLTENFIRELHKLILKKPYETDAITPKGKATKKKVKIGVYKTTPNHVRTKTGEIFRFATPEETPALMNDLINWYRNRLKDDSVDPILLASEFHYKYIRIHPFDDGNGRTARILMNFILMQFAFPPVIIKTGDKQNYYAALRQADAGSIEPFINYIAQNLIHSLELLIKGAKGESIEDPDDLDKEIAMLDQQLKTVGQPIKIEKSRESLLVLYDTTIAKLTAKFIEKGKLFEKFYAGYNFLLSYDGGGITSLNESVERTIQKNRNVISEQLKTIKLQYFYEAFNRTEFKEFNFKSEIIFQFQPTKYIVKDLQGKVTFEKFYDEQLTEEEMSQLVSAEVRRHKEFIEEKIESTKKKKVPTATLR